MKITLNELRKIIKEEMIKLHDPDEEKELSEVSPEGWEGTVKAMKKHDEIDNPWALSWWHKNQGHKSHKKDKK